MAQSLNTTISISIRKRWFCLPAMVLAHLLVKLRIIGDKDRAARWIVDNAMVLEVE